MIQTLFGETETKTGILPYDYQGEDYRNSFQLWDSGTVGVLTRCFTGGGKTIMSCLKIETWLRRGENYKAMVLSYEQELVHQFTQEIRDVLGNEFSVGIEMGSEAVKPGRVPQIVVASRQSLQLHELATQEQRDALKDVGLIQLGLLTKMAAKSALSAIRKGVDVQTIADGIEQFNADYRCDHERKRFSRLNKFDWRDNWLLVMDEAHKYSMKLKTVGHVVEWFEQNQNHRRSGVTATPKRRDKVSIGTKLFPGIALDFPFTKAVKDGYAVPYRQKFIQVESVDFRRLKEAAGPSMAKWDKGLDAALNTEKELAKLCDPMLDMVEDRKTLIFSPTVSMAKNVSDYINARSECECPSCGGRRWYPNMLLGDGAKCRECGDFITQANVTKGGIQAHSLDGTIPPKNRRQIYAGHKDGQFQFLSICGLCREGYNDPDVSCVAIFRPVTKDASSLAEQMKGRGSRVKRGCISGLNTVEDRLAAIAASGKTDCLIIDLVGVTGLADCASTVQIYSEGLPDAIVARAEQIALTGGMDDPEAAVEQAKREDAEEKERIRLQREAELQRRREDAERRSKLDAEVKYSAHEVGTAIHSSGIQGMASEGQLKFLHMLGMDFIGWEPNKKQAGRMIAQLKDEGKSPSEVAYSNGVQAEHWKQAGATINQARALARMGIDATGLTPIQINDAFKGKRPEPKPTGVVAEMRTAISRAETQGDLTTAGALVRDTYKAGKITESEYQSLCELGRRQRENVF